MLGCSLDMMYIICETVDTVLERDDPDYHSDAHLQSIRSIELHVQRLSQRHNMPQDEHSEETAMVLDVAELYRLAALIYLYRVARADSRDSKAVSDSLSKAFTILARIKSCDRPWPLFVLGLEARNDEHRKIILTILDGSTTAKRKSGNMALTTRMIRDAWICQDLSTTEIDPLKLYGFVISRNRMPASFFT